MPTGLRDRSVAITGGAGFVGSALTNRLASSNTIRILDLGLHGHQSPASESVEVMRGDVRDPAAVAAFLEGADIVLHLASIAGVASVVRNPVATMETTLLGAHNILQAAATHADVERVVLFSTSEVAGRLAYSASEDTALVGTRSGELRWTYAAAKLASEFQAAAFHAQYGVPTVCLRPFNIYGPGQLGPGAVREFVQRAVAREPLSVRGDGSQIRAWCYITDVVDAVELCCLHESAVGHVFNIGNPRSVVTVHELAKLVVRLAGSDSPIEFVPNTDVDVDLRVPDISRARSVLGFEPRVDLDEGIALTIAACRRSQQSEARST